MIQKTIEKTYLLAALCGALLVFSLAPSPQGVDTRAGFCIGAVSPRNIRSQYVTSNSPMIIPPGKSFMITDVVSDLGTGYSLQAIVAGRSFIYLQSSGLANTSNGQVHFQSGIPIPASTTLTCGAPVTISGYYY